MASPLPATILNVDDHAAGRYIRTRLLEHAGFRVIEATSGAATLEILAHQPAADLVLLDVNLPDMSGLDVCRAIKANPATASLPVLHVSASAVRTGDKTQGLESGAAGYLAEPVDPEELVATIRALLRISQAERFSQALNRVHAAIGSTLDVDQIMRRVVVEGVEAMRADAATIGVLDAENWTVRYAHGLEGIEGLRFAHRLMDPTSIGAALRATVKPLPVENVDTDPRINPAVKARLPGMRSTLFVPLVIRGELTGTLAFHFRSGPAAFSQAQMEFAGRLGASVSLALENARLYAEAEEGRRLLQALMDNIPEGISITEGPQGRIRMVSRHGQEAAGGAQEQLAGGTAAAEGWRVFCRDGITPAEPHQLPLSRALQQGEVVRDEEWVLERPDGGRAPLLCNAGPIRDASGAITGGVLAWRDISPLKRLEAQLAEARKMEAVAMLAGGVAHEFNNMLTVIAGHCQKLLGEPADRKSARRSLDTILKAANRLSKLTTQLLAFAGRQTIQPTLLDLNSIVRRVQGSMRHLLGERIQLTVALDAALPKVKADAGQMEQALLALAVHGRGGMAGGGRLVIETAKVELTSGATSEDLVLEPGLYAMLAVSDTGPALDEETRRHLFEPFSAGALNVEAGLGLSTVYGIARQNGGGARALNRPGDGTRIELYLPAE